MRSFNKKEIQGILTKAAELEMSKSIKDNSEHLTEDELLAIAKESGISSKSMKAAMNAMANPEFINEFSWLKGSTRIQHLEQFDHSLESEHLAKILRMLQNNESELGETELHSKNLSWTLQREIDSTKVLVYEDHGKTSFEYTSDWTALKFILGTFPFIIMFLITLLTTKGMGFDKFTSLLIAPFGGIFGLAGGWLFLKHKFEEQKAKLYATLDELRGLFLEEEDERISIEASNSINTVITNNQKGKTRT